MERWSGRVRYLAWSIRGVRLDGRLDGRDLRVLIIEGEKIYRREIRVASNLLQDDGDEAGGRDAEETEVYGQFRGPFLIEISEPASLFGDPLLCLW